MRPNSNPRRGANSPFPVLTSHLPVLCCVCAVRESQLLIRLAVLPGGALDDGVEKSALLG